MDKLASICSSYVRPFCVLGPQSLYLMLSVGGHNLDNKYGPIIRIGPNEVTTSDIPSVLTIHGARGFIKGKSYAAAMSGNPHAEDSSLISLRTR